jgi:hypothetical protein
VPNKAPPGGLAEEQREEEGNQVKRKPWPKEKTLTKAEKRERRERKRQHWREMDRENEAMKSLNHMERQTRPHKPYTKTFSIAITITTTAHPGVRRERICEVKTCGLQQAHVKAKKAFGR